MSTSDIHRGGPLTRGCETPIPPPHQPAGRPRHFGVEESPGSTETRCRITSGGGDPRESATEIRPLVHARARVKRWGKSPPRDRQRERHGKPHREQSRIGTTRETTPVLGGSSGLTARGAGQPASQMNGRHAGRDALVSLPAIQNPAYRPAGASPFRPPRAGEPQREQPTARGPRQRDGGAAPPPVCASSSSALGRMPSTITATPLGLGCRPSFWFSAGSPATPSRKKG